MSKYEQYLKLAHDPEVVARVLHDRITKLQEIEIRYNSKISSLKSKLTIVDACIEILPSIDKLICHQLNGVLDLRNVYRKALKSQIIELEQERDNELAQNS